MTPSLADTKSNFNYIMHSCVSNKTHFECIHPGFVIAKYDAGYYGIITKIFQIDQRTILEQCNDINHTMVTLSHQLGLGRFTVSKIRNMDCNWELVVS